MHLGGVYLGIVQSNDQGGGRVQVNFPWLDSATTASARVVFPIGSPPGGIIPVGTSVVVAFDHGDPRFPYVLGRLLGP